MVGRSLDDFLRPPPPSREEGVEEKGSKDDGRRPTSVRCDGGAAVPSTHDSRAQRGDPEGAGGRAQAPRLRRSTRAARRQGHGDRRSPLVCLGGYGISESGWR